MFPPRSRSLSALARICGGAIAATASPYERLNAEAEERPAIRALAGDVNGLDVLFVGAPVSEHASWLTAHGARVVTLESHVHDAGEPLPQQKESADLIFSSLTMHSVLEWEPLLRELHRVTRPSGALVFSIHHPCRGLHEGLGVDYFSTGRVEDGEVRYWRRPISAIVTALVETGWRITKMTEPRIADAVDPYFLIVRAAR
jgi:SAM-dependent methyltransferase